MPGVGRNEVGRHHPPCRVLLAATLQLATLLPQLLVVVVKRRNISPAKYRAAREGRLDAKFLLRLGGKRLDQGRGDDQLARLTLHGNDRVFEVRLDGRKLVAGKRPGRGGPDQEVGIGMIDQRETDVDARVGHLAIALPDLARTEGRATLSPPPDDLVPLIEKPAVEEVLQRPPHAFHVAAVVGNVSLVQVDPEAQPLGQLLPLLHVPKHALLALADERLHAEGLDLFLGVNAHLLAHLDLDGQSMGIPARLAIAAVATHRAIAGKQVFDGPREAMAGVRKSVGGGRAFVEHKGGVPLACLERLLVDPSLFPKSDHFGFERREGNRAFNRTKGHDGSQQYVQQSRIGKPLVKHVGPDFSTPGRGMGERQTSKRTQKGPRKDAEREPRNTRTTRKKERRERLKQSPLSSFV